MLSTPQRPGRKVQTQMRAGWYARLKAWRKVVRAQFYFLPWLALTAGALAASKTQSSDWQWLPYLCACLGAVLMEFLTVLTNEVHDLPSDRLNCNHGPLTGGSRALVDGDLTLAQIQTGRSVSFFALVILVLTVIWLKPHLTLPVLGLFGTGLALGLGYSMPPVRFSHRGLGEVVVAFTHSYLVVLAGWLSQTGLVFHAAPWLLALPMFLAVLPSIILAGFPDFEADEAIGKRTLAVRLGRQRAALLALACTLLTVSVFVALVFQFGGFSQFMAWGASLHAAILICMLVHYQMRGSVAGRIDSLLVASLTFMAWTILEPLFRHGS